MNTLSVPQPLDEKRLDLLRLALEEIQSERGRLEAFTAELSQEWDQVQSGLQQCHETLSRERSDLISQEEQLQHDRVHLESERDEARRATQRLEEVEEALQTEQQARSDWEAERRQIRQHLGAFRQGFTSLTEIVDLVQSTHAEFHRTAASVQEHASQLSQVLDELPLQEMVEGLHANMGSAGAKMSPAEDRDAVEALEEAIVRDPQPVVDATDGAEDLTEHRNAGHRAPDDAAKQGASGPSQAADPVVGSVLAELAKFVKSETGCCALPVW